MLPTNKRKDNVDFIYYLDVSQLFSAIIKDFGVYVSSDLLIHLPIDFIT